MDEETQLYLEQLAREAFKEFDNNNTGTIDQKVNHFIFIKKNYLQCFSLRN